MPRQPGSPAPRILFALSLSAFLLLVPVPLAKPAAAGGTQSAVAVSAGDAHTCVLKASANVHCYGSNADGQAAAYTGGDATAVSAGQDHTCVLKSGGNVDCYGANGAGQAADYTGGDATEVSGGGYHTCVLKATGNVDCYGSNSFGQAADYMGGDATAVSAGFLHTCVLTVSRNVDCYGSNGSGQAADYTVGDATAVSAGDFYTCVLTVSRNVDCYGDNSDGQANDYTGGDAVAVGTGYVHTCFVQLGGNVDCQGDNIAGQANDYTGGDATAVAVGLLHTCVLKADGNVDCYGSNGNGRAKDYGVPSAPQNLEAELVATGIRLTWSAPSSDGQFPITGYAIYRGFTSGAKVPLQTVGNQLSYVDPTCPLGTQCHYQVAAINSFGEGPLSNNASAIGQHVPLPSGMESCAVFNSQNGNPYPGQQGVVVKYVDGTHTAVCVAPAPTSECPVAGIVLNNVSTCVASCGMPGPGWSLGAGGQCQEAPWVAVHPVDPGCPPAATAGVVVYGLGGGVLFSVCV